MTGPPELHRLLSLHDEDKIDAWLTDIVILGFRRFTFLRLVEREESAGERVHNTIETEAHVDIDAEGNILGISLPLWKDGITRAARD